MEIDRLRLWDKVSVTGRMSGWSWRFTGPKKRHPYYAFISKLASSPRPLKTEIGSSMRQKYLSPKHNTRLAMQLPNEDVWSGSQNVASALHGVTTAAA